MKKEESFSYMIFNKPYGVLCQFTDPDGRPTLKDFIHTPGIYPVGRLDFDSEGLLFLTNDGKLNQYLSNPRHKQLKVYWVQVEGIPTEEMLDKLRRGVVLNGRHTLPAKVKTLHDVFELWERSKPIRFRKSIPTSWLEIIIREGKNHQVKKMTAAVGLPCLRLVRMAIGPMGIRNLKPGEYVFVKKPEVR